MNDNEKEYTQQLITYLLKECERERALAEYARDMMQGILDRWQAGMLPTFGEGVLLGTMEHSTTSVSSHVYMPDMVYNSRYVPVKAG